MEQPALPSQPAGIITQSLRKSLWLQVARHIINKKEDGWFKATAEIFNRCELLKIEDLLPLFPDFTEIDEFKAEIIASMESYNHNINQLNKDMDESVVLAKSIREEIGKYEKGFALVEPGEQCFLCCFPLVTRRFYVFHASIPFIVTVCLRQFSSRRITS